MNKENRGSNYSNCYNSYNNHHHYRNYHHEYELNEDLNNEFNAEYNLSVVSDEEYPNTFPGTPPSDSVSVYLQKENNTSVEDSLNKDLMVDDIDDLIDSLSSFSSMDILMANRINQIHLGHYPTLNVHKSITRSYLFLEFFASICLNVALCFNAFTFTILENNVKLSHSIFTMDYFLQYILHKALNLACIGLVGYIFTSPDTYKSINLTLTNLTVNAIIYEYSLSIS